jgi:hypothetical protein
MVQRENLLAEPFAALGGQCFLHTWWSADTSMDRCRLFLCTHRQWVRPDHFVQRLTPAKVQATISRVSKRGKLQRQVAGSPARMRFAPVVLAASHASSWSWESFDNRPPRSRSFKIEQRKAWRVESSALESSGRQSVFQRSGAGALA